MVGTGSLNYIRSPCSEYNIRVSKLHDKWRECQGINDWEGLLDPLDDDLRNEILRYGEFVEAAYRTFEFETLWRRPATVSLYPKTWMIIQGELGTSGYKVTKSLHATCSIELPSWIERLSHWESNRSNWIGYVAVCHDKDEIARLGRRDVVIVYRGTATCLEWLENLRGNMLTCLPDDMGLKNGNKPMVQSGFLNMYTCVDDETCHSLQDTVTEEVSKILRTYCDQLLSITITGHSLGAALATLTAYDITHKFPNAPLVTVISFGGPRVGNNTFRSQLETTGTTKVLRIVNSDDPITKIPGFLALPAWIQKRFKEMSWVYVEIGKELRVNSKDCPYLSKGRNMVTCHDLKTYLRLISEKNCVRF